MIKSAEISDCGRYRYSLRRAWGDGPTVAFIGLNPSTADAENDDPTIRRCIGFAQAWGYSSLLMLNLFALRSTNPSRLLFDAAPIGPDTDARLNTDVLGASLVVAAWGAHYIAASRGADVRHRLEALGVELHALGLTRSRQPKHPLYLPKGLVAVPIAALERGDKR